MILMTPYKEILTILKGNYLLIFTKISENMYFIIVCFYIFFYENRMSLNIQHMADQHFQNYDVFRRISVLLRLFNNNLYL